MGNSPKSPKPGADKQTQHDAMNAFLVAADALSVRGKLIEAELRYLDAMRTAEQAFGGDSSEWMLVASILAAFYRLHNRFPEAEELETRLASWQFTSEPEEVPQGELGELGKKFASKKNISVELDTSKVNVPQNMRKYCQILGLKVNESISIAIVNSAWKAQMLKTSAHPDLGGNTDEAILLNQAKEELIKYIESRAPKLGTKFKK